MTLETAIQAQLVDTSGEEWLVVQRTLGLRTGKEQDITELTYTFAHRTFYTTSAPLSHSPPDVDLL